LNIGIGELLVGSSIVVFTGVLTTPIILWIVTIYYYRKYQKDKTRN
jgi:hypothetical protein